VKTPYLWMILLAALTVGAWAEAGETLALTVHVVTMPPNEEGQDYREAFYVDSSGLLIRIRRVSVEPLRDGSPSDYSTVFRWVGHSVEWSDASEKGHATVEDSVVSIDRGNGAQSVRFAYDAERVQWERPDWTSSWSPSVGFASGPPEPSDEPQQFGYATAGARLTEWFRGHPNTTVILDKTPRAYRGTLVEPNDVGPGWLTVGFLEVSGKGLWSPQVWVRELLVAILDESGRYPLWVPFVLEEKFLR
jgi:hypothetical protein